MRIQNRLASSSHSELAQVSIRIENHAVTLEGRVRSYYIKQIAQELVMSMDGVAEVRNVIDVVD